MNNVTPTVLVETPPADIDGQVIHVPYYYGWCLKRPNENEDFPIKLKYFKNEDIVSAKTSITLKDLDQISEKRMNKIDGYNNFMVFGKIPLTKYQFIKAYTNKTFDILVYFKRGKLIYPMFIKNETPSPSVEVSLTYSTHFIFDFGSVGDHYEHITNKKYNNVASKEGILWYSKDAAVDYNVPITLSTAEDISLSVHCVIGNRELSGSVPNSSLSNTVLIVVGKQTFKIQFSNEKLQAPEEEDLPVVRHFRTYHACVQEGDFAISKRNKFLDGTKEIKWNREYEGYILIHCTLGFRYFLELNKCNGYVYKLNESDDKNIDSDFASYTLVRKGKRSYRIKKDVEKMLVLNISA